MPDFVAPDVRPAGRLVLFPYTALSYFGPGSKEPVWIHDLVTQSGPYGTPTYTVETSTGLHVPTVITSPNRYMALYPSLNHQDMVTGEWSASPRWTDEGTWSTREPLQGTGNQARLVQTKADADKKFSRRSSWDMPTDVSFFLRLQLGEDQSSGNTALGQRFAAVAWANFTWFLFFFPDHPPLLAEMAPGGIFPRLELPPIPTSSASGEFGDAVYRVEKIRNSVVVTAGFGLDRPLPPPNANMSQRQWQQYTWGQQAVFSRPEGVTWPEGPLDFFGLGLQASMLVGQVHYPALGRWKSPMYPLFQPRGTFLGTDEPIYTSQQNLNGGTITPVHLNTADDYFFQYQLSLTPWSQTVGSRTWMKTPDVESITSFYPAWVQPPSPSIGDNGALFERRMLSAKITKPHNLAENNFQARAFFPEGFQLEDQAWMMRPCTAWLGQDTKDGVTLHRHFTGFLVSVKAEEEPETGEVLVNIEAMSGAIRARRSRFPRRTGPRGGRTLNQSLNVWVAEMGMSLSEVRWHPLGDTIWLPLGTPEDPAFMPPGGGDAWDWHQDLLNLFGLELIWTDDGFLISWLKRDYIDTGFTWRANPQDVREGMMSLSAEADALDVCSRVVLYARDINGYGLIRWAWNRAAEQFPNYRGFRNWIEEKSINVDFGPITAPIANLAIQSAAEDHLFPRIFTNFEGVYAPFMGRKQRVGIAGDRMQAQGLYVIETTEHDIPEGEDEHFQAKTRAVAWRRMAPGFLAPG